MADVSKQLEDLKLSEDGGASGDGPDGSSVPVRTTVCDERRDCFVYIFKAPQTVSFQDGTTKDVVLLKVGESHSNGLLGLYRRGYAFISQWPEARVPRANPNAKKPQRREDDNAPSYPLDWPSFCAAIASGDDRFRDVIAVFRYKFDFPTATAREVATKSREESVRELLCGSRLPRELMETGFSVTSGQTEYSFVFQEMMNAVRESFSDAASQSRGLTRSGLVDLCTGRDLRLVPRLTPLGVDGNTVEDEGGDPIEVAILRRMPVQ